MKERSKSKKPNPQIRNKKRKWRLQFEKFWVMVVHVGTPLHQSQLAIWANCGQSYVIGCGTRIFPLICASPTKPFFSSIKLRTYSSFLFSYFFPWAQFSFSLTIKLLKAFVQVLFMAEENAMWVILVVHVVWWWDWFGFKEQWGSGWL